MDDFGSVIKFLVLAGIVLISIVRKFAKLKLQPQQPAPNTFSKEMEEIMQQMREEKEEQKPAFQTVKPAPLPMRDELARSYLTKKPAKEMTPAAETSDILLEENLMFNNLDIKLSNPQDAKQAFIYSEIFQRKY